MSIRCLKKNRRKRCDACGGLAEMEGFEPPHALRRLPDFESGPFSHLGTSPVPMLLCHRIARIARKKRGPGA